MTPVLQREPSCYNKWFEQSGLPELHELGTPLAYAARLCRYIGDPTTVRARTLEAFNRAPDLDQIRHMRSKHLAEIARRSRDRNDGAHKHRKSAKAAPKPKPVIAPSSPVAGDSPAQAPVMMPVAARGYVLHTAIEVIDACADVCGISHGELIGTSRKREFSRARNLCAAVLRARGNSLCSIGRFLRRDHSTIISGIERFFSRDIRDEELAAAWLSLAPCVLKACRSSAEITAAAVVPK